MIGSERRALQIAILIAGIVPVTGGLIGILSASTILRLDAACGPTCDSHVRYLSGLLLGIGLVVWSLVPWIERAGRTLQLVTVIVVIGGLARLSSLLLVGQPSSTMLSALVMELVITPLLCAWQRRVAHWSRPL